MLRHWSTTTSVPAAIWENSSFRSFSALATRWLATTSPSLVTQQAQCAVLPTSRPNTAVQVSASGIMVISFQSSVDRNAASCDTHITWPWLALWSEGPAVSYQSSETATPASATPPGPSRGRGERPSTGARSAVL